MATRKPVPRLWFQTKTADCYYWYLGESLTEINESFSRLYEQYPLKSNITIGDPQDGLFDAEIFPPTVLVPDCDSIAGRSDVLLQVRFKDGAIISIDCEEYIGRFSGWTITVPIQMETSKVEINASMSAQASYAALERNNWTNSPLDPESESFYLRLSSVRWELINSDYTHCGLDEIKRPISFDNWVANNKRSYETLIKFLRQWALDETP